LASKNENGDRDRQQEINMAHAGKRWRHRTDDRPQKHPPPIRDAALLQPLRETPQANARGLEYVPRATDAFGMVTNQNTNVGALAGTSVDKDVVTTPGTGAAPASAPGNGSAVPRRQLHGGTEHIE
jgi:hypothetical protein